MCGQLQERKTRYFNDSSDSDINNTSDCIDSDNSNTIDSSDSYNIDNINNMSPKIETITFDRTKIRKAISGVKLEASPGPYGISPALLKIICDQILELLEKIFSKSFEDGIFPIIWKKSDITPIKKPGKSNLKPKALDQ